MLYKPVKELPMTLSFKSVNKTPSKFSKIRNGLVQILKYIKLLLLFGPSEVIIEWMIWPKIEII